jgi:hypothetical protein
MKRSDRTLVPDVKLWLIIIGAMNLQDGVAFALLPQATGSNAYDWARTVLPGVAWGLLFTALGGASWWLLWMKHRLLIRLVVTLQTLAFMTFGLSILGLTLNGSTSAITGANKWATYGILGAWFLFHPIYEIDEPEG